jgi:hypothetical protein
MQHGCFEFADVEGFVRNEQTIELRAVWMKLGLEVEHRAEDLLHRPDVLADAGRAAQVMAQIRRRR